MRDEATKGHIRGGGLVKTILSHLAICSVFLFFFLMTACSPEGEDVVKPAGTESNCDNGNTENPQTDGDDDAEASDNGNTENPQTDGDEPQTGDYPAGPYGYSLNDTMADFSLPNCEGEMISLKDFHPDAKAILINHSAGWCSVCRDEMGTLNEWYEELSPDGFVLIQALFENNAYMPADAAFCQGWQARYETAFPILVDADNYFFDYHPTVQEGGINYATPLNLILNAEMKIVYLLEGDVPHSMYDLLVETMASE